MVTEALAEPLRKFCETSRINYANKVKLLGNTLKVITKKELLDPYHENLPELFMSR